MAENLSALLSPESPSTRIRACLKCGAEVREDYQLPEFTECLGRKIKIGGGTWDLKLTADGLCDSCEDERRQTELVATQKRWKQVQEETYRKNLIELLGGQRPFDEFTFARFIPGENKAAFEAAKNFNPDKENLFLCGECGTGKTHLAVAIARTFYNTPGRRVEYWKTIRLLRYLRYERNAHEEERVIDRLASASVLVLDDLGAQKETDFGTQMILEIIDRRYEKRRNGLVVTSNYGRNDLATIFKDRIPSRISGLCGQNVFRLKGPDRRTETGGRL